MEVAVSLEWRFFSVNKTDNQRKTQWNHQKIECRNLRISNINYKLTQSLINIVKISSNINLLTIKVCKYEANSKKRRELIKHSMSDLKIWYYLWENVDQNLQQNVLGLFPYLTKHTSIYGYVEKKRELVGSATGMIVWSKIAVCTTSAKINYMIYTRKVAYHLCRLILDTSKAWKEWDVGAEPGSTEWIIRPPLTIR